MNAPVAFLIDNAAMLLAGSTVLLAIGAIAVAVCRAPLHRRRLAELTVLGVVVWLIAAIAPLPRWHRSPDAAPELPLAARAVEAAPPAFELAAALRREPRPPTLAAGPATNPVIPARPSIGPQPMPALTRGPNLRAALGQVAWGPPLTESSRDATIRETTDPLAAGAAPSWPRVLAWSYFAGSGLALGWLLLGFRSLHRMLRRSQPAAPWLTALFDELHTGTPGRRPHLRIAADIAQPFCCGLRAPTIVLPRALAMPAQRSRLRQVLLHELAHLQQRDLRGRTLFAVTLPLLFFHPLYWWLRATARLSAELVADECAAGHSDRTTYARELLSICEEFGRRRVLVGTAPVFATRSEFYRRMKMLLQRERPLVMTCSPLRRATQACAMVLLVAGTASLFGVEARAQVATTTRAAEDEGLEELRAERDRLRSELRAMRKAFASAQRTTAVDPVAELPPEPPEPPEPASPLLSLPRLPDALAPGSAPAHGVLDLLPRPANPLAATENELPPLATLADVFAQPAAAPQPPVPPTPSGDAYVLDLVMRSIELHGEFELQQAALEDAARNRDAAAGTESEVRTAEIKLRTAERKRRVVDRAIDGELARVADQLDNEDLSPSDRRRLQRQLELLEGGRAPGGGGQRSQGGR